MSALAVKVMRQARRAAARHGTLFLSSEHVEMGLLETPSATTSLLKSRGVTYESVRELIESKVLLPVSSSLQEGDVDLAPRTRTTLIVAQECARDTGSSLLGTAHIASALLQDPRSTICLFLDAQGIPPRVVEEEIISSWEQQPETLNADVPSTEQQVEELKRKFAEMQSQQGGGKPPAPMQMGGRKDEQADDVYE